MTIRTFKSAPKPRVHPLRRERLRAKLTLQQVGDHVGVKRAAVSYWELGHRLPEPTSALALLRLFPKLTIEQLYKRAA